MFKTGAHRDMVVNHLFQILAFTAMEPPTALAARPISEEKNKVFRSLSPMGAHGPDHLTFDLADASELSLSFYGKRPGPGMTLDKQSLHQLIAPKAWRLPFERAWRES